MLGECVSWIRSLVEQLVSVLWCEVRHCGVSQVK